MADPARLAGVGVFVLGGLLLFGVGLFMIGDRQMAFSRRFTVYTEFAKITGIAPGTIVRVAGAKAGTVKDVLPPNRPSLKFRVRLEIVEDLHPLVRTDSIATIETEGLVGGTFLAVGIGSDQAPKAPENSTIPGKEPFGIADLMDQLRNTVMKINATIDDLKVDVDRAVVSIAETVDTTNGLLTDVGDDVRTMASAGARITGDVADISDRIRNGTGTIGKLVNDDELYRRTTAIAQQAEEIAANTRMAVERTRLTVEQARQTIENLQSRNGPIQGLASDLKRTTDDARDAMAGLAENMEALKHNFLFRGFFNQRGYFDLARLSPAEYRNGALTRGGERRAVRVWLGSPVLFEQAPEPSGERLTEDGRHRLDSAIAPYLDHLADVILVIEGYARDGSHDEQFVRSRSRAQIVCDYLIGKFHLDAQATGLMPLGNASEESPSQQPWDGVALAVYFQRRS